MAAPVYATEADLADSPYLPDTVTAPTGAAAVRVLTRASRRVDRLLLTAVYDVDTDTGLPTDPQLVDAFREATCAQAAWWLETGDESGAAAQFQSAGIGSVSLGRGYSGAGSATGPDQTTSPDAVQVLADAGLTAQAPVVGWARIEC